VTNLPQDETLRVFQLVDRLKLLDDSTRQVVLHALKHLGEKRSVISNAKECLAQVGQFRRDDSIFPPEFSSRSSPDASDTRVAMNLFERLRALSPQEESLKAIQRDAALRLVQLEESKRSLWELFTFVLRSPSVPEDLREQALREHSAEEVGALVGELQSAGSFTSDDILADLNRGAESGEPTGGKP
jgi:hypothetical protein